ncbi:MULTISPECIES: CPBP family intramembrane glutamic endopeptidase [Microbacterium]|jgi:membrane protease YdiL (CAAX protease family)|uniref:CPBP family intramembrane glutamic endopeptidase n=1 Tax=Microbacterium TaxID=33882 RepID=UPI0023D9B3B3|nr:MULTISPECIES: type II CAAX endopeptidase family protein [Microbacterium]MDF2044638.1 type II CAAX endopeptidase family protein [Microbacterium sp. Kw_RZR3]MDQ1074279.1 membrane protease YdiL (CAAX protease family) [Microbacterium sp. SORGH_AS_0969]MDQ1114506.1 membrane protease YdiL (CAAX protease family) [Microbacterium testaceum]
MSARDAESLDGAPMRRRRRRPHRAWREGGATTAPWGLELLGWATAAAGAGALVARALAPVLPASSSAIVSQAVIWVSLAVPVVWAWSRSRPRGLLAFRAVDVLYGAVLGVTLRFVQGALAQAESGPLPWPSTPSVDGALPDGFVVDAISAVVVAPVLEELLFRGVVLVCAYTIVRRWAGRVAGGIAATAISAALFVSAHLLAATLSVPDVWALALVGVVTAVLVLGTGRLWGAVATHIVFNATGVVLVAVGTLWG